MLAGRAFLRRLCPFKYVTAVNAMPLYRRFLLKDLEPGKKEALVYAVIGYYMSALQRGQLKDLIGMEKVLNFFEFTEFPIELPEKERIEFFLMHLPPDFWTGLSESVYGGKITPQVQTHLKTYHQLGAPKRPQLAQFQDELEARSTQRLEKGDADNVERRHGLVQINSRGYLVPVFDAVTPTDEALRVRGSLISWLVDSGELSRTHGGPLPIRYSRGAERFRERHRDTADKQDQQDIAAQVQMLQPQILNAIRNSDEEELRRLHAQIALINGPHTQPTTIPIFEPGASETGLSMSAPKADPALDAYCMEVARTLIQTYFPNTRITAKDVEFILSMRELVMIQLGKNPALEEISQKELGGIFAPLGLSDPKNILDTGKSTPKMLEYIDSTEETAKKAAEEEKKKDFQERISSAVQQLSAQWDGITGSARRQRVSIYDTGLANPDHSYQANENARHNAKVDRQSGASIDALFKMIEFLRKTQNQHEIWQWMIHELEMALLAGNNKFQSCFKKGGGIDWGQVGILQRSIPYNSHAPDRERQILSALQSIYRCFWI